MTNLIVSTRSEERYLRFDVQGHWQYNDALNLAYQIKAATQKQGIERVLVDVRRVLPAPEAQGKFFVCDRLRRALAPSVKVALLAPVALVDVEARHNPATATVVVFASERSALLWLDGIHAAIKNPSVLRAEG